MKCRMLLTKQAEELNHIWSIVVVKDDLISVISVTCGVSQMKFIHWTMVRPTIPSGPFCKAQKRQGSGWKGKQGHERQFCLWKRRDDIFVSWMEKIIRERKAISDLRKRQLETKERWEKDQGLLD